MEYNYSEEKYILGENQAATNIEPTSNAQKNDGSSLPPLKVQDVDSTQHNFAYPVSQAQPAYQNNLNIMSAPMDPQPYEVCHFPIIKFRWSSPFLNHNHI